MNPTAEQLTRAAELAPRVLDLADIPFARWPGHEPEILHPGIFYRIIHALPEDVYNQAAERAAYHPDSPPRLLPFTRWLLTPAGMLAFYEALAKLEEGAVHEARTLI